MMISYLAELTMRLAGGAMMLPEERRAGHARFLESLQCADGGFPGREGGGDCYYSGFSLRALVLLGLLNEPTARAATRFFAERLQSEVKLPSVDYLSVVFSDVLLDLTFQSGPFAKAGLDRLAETVARLEPYRCKDGGYAKSLRGGASSTYHTFLTSACKQLIELKEDRTDQIVQMLRSRQRDDGGFVELGPLKQSGTNPTAAAIGTLRLLGIEDRATRTSAIEFLRAMQTPDGGFRANTRIPVTDLLSTFTALVAMVDLDAVDQVDLPAARRYVESLEYDAGGFRAGSWDEKPDAEYTFYGVGALAILNAAEE